MPFTEVSRSSPCPICGKDHYCGVDHETGVVRCKWAPSPKESVDRRGCVAWIHRLDESQVDAETIERIKLRAAQQTNQEMLPAAEIMRLAREWFVSKDAKTMRRQVANQLNVPEWTLRSLRVGSSVEQEGWNQGKRFSSWPSRNGRGGITGIVKRFSDGRKLTLRQTSNGGIFIPSPEDRDYWNTQAVWLLEGGSDTAAAIARGFPALGRPSNTGGQDAIIQWMKHHGIKHAIVWGENDQKDTCSLKEHCLGLDCPGCWPGLFGANRLRSCLTDHGIEATVQMPPAEFKDIRELLYTHPMNEIPLETRSYPSFVESSKTLIANP